MALEALSGELVLAELVSKYDVHPTQITDWKCQAKEDMGAAFSGKAATVLKDAGVAISMDGNAGGWVTPLSSVCGAQ